MGSNLSGCTSRARLSCFGAGVHAVDRTPTCYANARYGQIAYQLRGSGPAVASISGTTGLAVAEDPLGSSYFERLLAFCRLVVHDPRGTGRSDPLPPGTPPTIDDQVDDLVVVLDDAGIDSAFISTFHAGAAVAVRFAVRYPERTDGLFIVNGWARLIRGEGYPYGLTPEFSDRLIEAHGRQIGTGMFADAFSPSRAGDPEVKAFYARIEPPSRAQAMLLTRMAQEADVRDMLGRVTVPTVVMHSRDNSAVAVEHGRYLASEIPEARFVEFDGTDHLFFLENPEPVLIELEAFVTGNRPESRPDHGFATIVFTDLVNSTIRAVEIGDRRWRELIERYERDITDRASAHGGRTLKSTGDGMLVIFPVPSYAVRCGRALLDVSARIGLESRVGIHAGEVELRGSDVNGLAVNIGARVCALADPGEVLVTRTVKDLLAGSGFPFADRGTYTLKGVPDTWQLFSI
jgi:class 3 adenylate cyclase/pimeloyl-ACP methyl ester carboxylesterase